MRRFLLICILAVVAVSCSPQAFTILVDKSAPSESGLDLNGKSICLVYVRDGVARDSVFSSNFCDGFAQGLESRLFNGKKAVEVFSVGQDSDKDFGSRDEMVKLVVETNADVVFLLDKPMLNVSEDGQRSCIFSVYAYDSMSKKDVVTDFRKSAMISDEIRDREMFASDAQYLGFDFSKRFEIEWEKRQYSFIYFESMNPAWTQAIEAVYQQNWQAAIDIWIPFAEADTGQMASCASYNVALACHLLGENKLALEWLDHSDKVYPVSLSPGLRKRIEAEL